MAQQGPAWADDQEPGANKLDRVEVTGTLIKHSIEDEGALPITVIKTEDLARTGATTAEELMRSLAIVQNAGSGAVNVSNAIGATTGGQSTASLRGLGPNYTLILLNGKRVANFAFAPGSGDVGAVPLSAIERVEVLRDGASAVYGTDAIGGVVNFITKKDFQGFTIDADQASPDSAGGTVRDFSVTGGLGSLEKQGFNLLASYGIHRQQELLTTQRDFAFAAANTPNSSNTNPANYSQQAGGITWNPSLPACAPPFNLPAGRQCRAAAALYYDLIPYYDQSGTYAKAQVKLGADHTAALEYYQTERNDSARTSPDPHGLQTLNPNSPYFPGNGNTPLPPPAASSGGTVFNPALPINIKWRTVPNGKRQQDDHATEDRIAATLEGTLFSSYEYSAAIFTTHSRVQDQIASGFTDSKKLQNLLDGTNTTGVNPNNIFVNPFGPNSAAQLAALAGAKITGGLINSVDSSHGVSAQVSHEFAQLAGGPLQGSVGVELRKEQYEYNVNDTLAASTFTSTGVAPGTSITPHSRKSNAIYVEADAPITKELDADLAVRTDHYDGFGSTTNPKLSLRYQPSRELLFRASAATGFRAPDLYQLYQPPTVTNTSGSTLSDPAAGCVLVDAKTGTYTANPGYDVSVECGNQQNLLYQGNPNLKPEKSKQFTFGVGWQPVPQFKATVDVWATKITDQVRQPGEGALFGNPTQFASAFVSCAAAPAALAALSTNCLPGELLNLAYVKDGYANIGSIDARGIDIGLNYDWTNVFGAWNASTDIAYINRYMYQLYEGGPVTSNLGVYSNDLNQTIFRYQAVSSLGWKTEAWSANLVNRFKSGYTDSDPSHHVPQYFLWDVGVGYTGIRNLTINFAIRNLLNSSPPFSNQTNTFVKGYDPYNADPIDRVYFVSLKYEFGKTRK